MLKKIKNGLRPYVDQYNRCPLHVKFAAAACVLYLSIPIDPFDVLFPWMAFADDLFVAGLLLKLLHKYGSLPGDEKITPAELLTKIIPPRRKKTAESHQRTSNER